MEKISLTVMMVGLALVLAMITAPAFIFNNDYLLVLAKKEKSSDSSSNGNPADNSGNKPKLSEANPNPNPNPNSNPEQQQDQQQSSSPPTTTDNPIVPTNPNPDDKPICKIPEGCKPPNPTITTGQPDFSCHFHPESPKCAPDKDGNCPPGFAHNDKGQCHPEGPCPTGFSRHDDDESGKCFRTGGPIHFPPVIIQITKVIHSSSSSSSSSSSTSLSKACFDAIKIAWLGKVHRGQNHEVDKFIDNCLKV